jgi:hypothetical protein
MVTSTGRTITRYTTPMTTTPSWGHIQEGDTPVFSRLDDGRTDAVYELDGQWGFVDPAWADSFGPFDSREEAEAVCKRMADMMSYRRLGP